MFAGVYRSRGVEVHEDDVGGVHQTLLLCLQDSIEAEELKSMKKLQVDYIDLVLIHSPAPRYVYVYIEYTYYIRFGPTNESKY